MNPEQIKKMLEELGLDAPPELDIKPMSPCANEQERAELREELSKLHYEGNATDGFVLVGCKHQYLFRENDSICVKCGHIR